MSDQSPQKPKVVGAVSRPTVKCTVLIDVSTHSRLAAAAALRGCSRSTLAARYIKAGLKGIVVIDKDGRKNLSHRVETSDRPDESADISGDDENEAA